LKLVQCLGIRYFLCNFNTNIFYSLTVGEVMLVVYATMSAGNVGHY